MFTLWNQVHAKTLFTQFIEFYQFRPLRNVPNFHSVHTSTYIEVFFTNWESYFHHKCTRTSPQMPLLLVVVKDDVEPIPTRIQPPQTASNTTTTAPSDHQIYKSCDHITPNSVFAAWRWWRFIYATQWGSSPGSLCPTSPMSLDTSGLPRGETSLFSVTMMMLDDDLFDISVFVCSSQKPWKLGVWSLVILQSVKFLESQEISWVPKTLRAQEKELWRRESLMSDRPCQVFL